MYDFRASDAAFTLFLAGLSRSKVLRERESNFSSFERKVARFVREVQPEPVIVSRSVLGGFTQQQVRLAETILGLRR